MEHETKNIRVHGRVQGVGYRAWAAELANRVRLTGWVRNISKDQSVEITITGHQDDVQKFISECYKGPASSQVEIINVIDGFNEELEAFEIRKTH